MDATIVAIIALLVDAVVGDMKWLFSRIGHPVALFGSMIKILDRHFNHDRASNRKRKILGLLVTLGSVGIAIIIGWLLSYLTMIQAFGWLIEVSLVSIFVAQRSLFDHVLKVARALRGGDLVHGQEAVQHIVGRDSSFLDRHGVARASIESLAENFGDGVVAPIFWYLCFGLPGLLAYKVINTLDSMIGYRSVKYASFGFVAARLDDIVNWIPARITALLFILAAVFVPNTHPLQAFKVMWRDGNLHSSVNAGWPEGAMAGALSLSLGGPRQYPDGVSEKVWIGDGNPLAHVNDIYLALLLFFSGCLLNALGVAGFGLLRFI